MWGATQQDDHSWVRLSFFLRTTQPATPQITSWVSPVSWLSVGGSSDARRLPILRAAINHWNVIGSEKKLVNRKDRFVSLPCLFTTQASSQLALSSVCALAIQKKSAHQLIAIREVGRSCVALPPRALLRFVLAGFLLLEQVGKHSSQAR